MSRETERGATGTGDWRSSHEQNDGQRRDRMPRERPRSESTSVGSQRASSRERFSGRGKGRVEPELSAQEQERRSLHSVRPRHDDPDLPDDVQAKDLDRVSRNELRTLSKDNAEWVARHLVMAGRLLDEDPQLAHRHVLSAARRAGRIAVVRESLAISAYAVGDFALALRELRTFRRISGSDEYVPLMVDSERGIGRPDKALELGRSVDRGTLSVGSRVSLAIAMSGARLDLGQSELALMELEIPQLNPDRAFSYSSALFSAYALVLEELGRGEEAAQWQRRADIAESAVSAVAAEDADEIIEVLEEEYAQPRSAAALALDPREASGQEVVHGTSASPQTPASPEDADVAAQQHES
ncbi:hypothetical protein [Rathayibacter toxicus]|uniref:hypothetical protein n=1 Tax=Rathayibacter toxicus TaxID=145458 RepID=UPI001E59C7CE|nr:hypothetical protein [Rathayibacter toxicus]